MHERRRVRSLITLTCALLLWAIGSAGAENLLRNPSFELDEDNDGHPDGWDVHRDATVTFTDRATDGLRAIAAADGYNFVQQNLQVENMAGCYLSLRMDVATLDGARLGVMYGYMQSDDEGKQTWQNRQITWDREVGDQYATQRFVVPIADSAVGTRLWIGLYRSNQAGTILLDNVHAALHDLSPDELVQMNVIEREWRYLHERAASVQSIVDDNSAAVAVAEETQTILDGCFAGDRTMLSSAPRLTERLRELSGGLNALVHPDVPVAAGFCRPYEQLQPGEVLALPLIHEGELVGLAGEHRATGLMLSNAAEVPMQCAIRVEGLDDDDFRVAVRKQCFMENWYTKERERVADPLTLLPEADGSWIAHLQRGEIARLAIQFHCLSGPVDVSAMVVVEPEIGAATHLPLRTRILSSAPPPADSFNHIAFIYPDINVAGHSPDLTAADLGAHGVTMMEFPYLPPCEFSAEGELISVDFTTQEAWVKSYCPHIRWMMIFWAPAYAKLPCGDDEFLEPHTPAWNRAIVELLAELFRRSEEWGYGIDHFAILPYDEPHSATYADSPDGTIESAVAVMALFKEHFPQLPQIVTLSNYTYPGDLEAIVPYMDIAAPHWPLPEKLRPEYAPATYSPREAFTNIMEPMLQTEREKRGMHIWSYHVAGGKNDDVLRFNRGYPLRAFGARQRGVGTWAYNVPRGTTWDDTETGVDYIFVYDGRENHPTNRQLNPTGEIVVPSIRWEALREGIQDARVLVTLEKALAEDRYPEALRPRARDAIAAARAMASDNEAITWEAVDALSAELKTLWAEMPDG